jgi:hypothetical protein
VRRIEARIADLTGIAPHGDETLMFNARWENEYDIGNNLHHDTNRAPRRVASLLMYLTGGAESEYSVEGGDTYFPCLRPFVSAGGVDCATKESKSPGGPASCLAEHEDPAEEEQITNSALSTTCVELERLVMQGQEIVFSDDTATKNAVAGCACKDGVRGKVRAGDMLLFAAADAPDASQPLPQMWHKGCEVKKGTKFFVAKFKARRWDGAWMRKEHAQTWHDVEQIPTTGSIDFDEQEFWL